LRRQVRLTDSFFRDLDEQLPIERTHLPSRRDVEVRELVAVLDLVADGWEDLPRFLKGRDDYRELYRASDLGLVLRVECQLAPDGAIELVGLDIDVAPPWGGDEAGD
jgi:hypothetical protein